MFAQAEDQPSDLDIFLSLPSIQILDDEIMQELRGLAVPDEVQSPYARKSRFERGLNDVDFDALDAEFNDALPNAGGVDAFIDKLFSDQSTEGSLMVTPDKSPEQFVGQVLCIDEISGMHSVESRVTHCEKSGTLGGLRHPVYAFTLESGDRVELRCDTAGRILRCAVTPQEQTDLRELLMMENVTAARYDRGLNLSVADLSLRQLLPNMVNAKLTRDGKPKQLSTHKRRALIQQGILTTSSSSELLSYTAKFAASAGPQAELQVYLTAHKELAFATMFSSTSGQAQRLQPRQLRQFVVKPAILHEIPQPTTNVAVKFKSYKPDPSELMQKRWKEVESLRKTIIAALSIPQQADYIRRSLFNLRSTQLKRIDLADLQDIAGPPQLSEQLEALVELYGQLGRNVSKEQLMAELVLEVNYTQVAEKEQNWLVLKAMEILRAAFEQIDRMAGKNLVMFVGRTGAGKSTTVNWLSGRQLVETWNDVGEIVYELEGEQQDAAVIGQSIGTSQTSYVQGFVPNGPRLDSSNSSGELMLCDCPGFDDNRGQEYNLATELSIAHSVKEAGRIGAVVAVVDKSAFTMDRANPVLGLIEDIEERLPGAFTNPTSAAHAGVWMIVTKTGSPEESPFVSGFEERLRQHVEEEKRKLNDINRRGNQADTWARQHTERRRKIWMCLQRMFSNKTNPRLLFVDIGNRRALNKAMTQFRQSPGIPKSAFQQTMAMKSVQQDFGRIVELSVHSWRVQILKEYHEKLPSDITAARQAIDAMNATVRDLRKRQQKLHQDMAAAPETIAKLQTQHQQLQAALDSGGHEELEQLLSSETVTELTEELTSSETRRLERQQDDLNEQLTAVQKKKSTKQQQLDEKHQQIREIAGEISQLEDDIAELSIGSHDQILRRYRYKPDEMVEYGTLKDGRRSAAFNEVRRLEEDDWEPGSSKKVRARDYEGTLSTLVYIEREYRLVPADAQERRAFEQYRRTSDGKYAAVITGHKYHIDTDDGDGVKTAPDGKRMVYSISTTWNASRDLPWFEISHSQPCVDVNEATIINSDADKTAKLKRKSELEAECALLQEDVESLGQQIDSIGVEIKANEAAIKRNREMATLDTVRGLIERYEELIASNRSQLRLLQQEMDHIEQQVLAQDEAKQAKTMEIEQIEYKLLRLAVIIVSQWDIAQLLRRFAEILQGEARQQPGRQQAGLAAEQSQGRIPTAGGARTAISSSGLYAACADYIAFFDEHGARILASCKERVQPPVPPMARPTTVRAMATLGSWPPAVPAQRADGADDVFESLPNVPEAEVVFPTADRGKPDDEIYEDELTPADGAVSRPTFRL